MANIGNFAIKIFSLTKEDLTSDELDGAIYDLLLDFQDDVSCSAYDDGYNEGFSEGEKSAKDGYYQEGYDEGFEEGYEEGKKEVLDSMNKTAKDWL